MPFLNSYKFDSFATVWLLVGIVNSNESGTPLDGNSKDLNIYIYTYKELNTMAVPK
jgi:hypothetical protein